jgi:hypothetical protein
VQYLMLIYRDRVPVDRVASPAGGDVEDWVSRMNARGVRLAGEPLAPDRDATTVRVRGGVVQADAGAFMDSGGALLGFDLLDCRDPDEAVTVAAEHPLAARHVLELRPVASAE